jgi:glycosyltransferase involved in cell wall biosynthesis
MQRKDLRCSIIIPVYNEKDTILKVINSVEAVNINKEIIVIDDFSTDGTREIIKNQKDIKVIYHGKNKGKGAAMRTGLECATGDVFIIQDSDLEYNPEEIPKLLEPIERGEAQVVYGSRFKGKGEFLFLSFIANKFLTFFTNLLYGSHLTDMETCYKCMKMDIIRNLDLKAKRFEFEPEVTAKILKRGYKIYEVPISYFGRKKGKKIGWKDGIQAMVCLFKYRFID